MIDLGSEYTISNIKIQDLTEGDVVTHLILIRLVKIAIGISFTERK
jgi:hypothetical protein